jgi:hypothetical protein
MLGVNSNVERVEDLMEKVNENIALGDEVSDMVSQPIGPIMDEVLHIYYDHITSMENVMRMGSIDGMVIFVNCQLGCVVKRVGRNGKRNGRRTTHGSSCCTITHSTR